MADEAKKDNLAEDKPAETDTENTTSDPTEHTAAEETPAEEPTSEPTPDDETAAEADEIPANMPAPAPLAEAEPPAEPTNKFKRFLHRYWAKKKWTLPLSVVVLILLLLAVPLSRYPILGTFLKKDYTVVVLDSTTKLPVSAATVSLGSVSAKTDATGTAKLHTKVGKATLTVSKSYYKAYTSTAFVGIGKASTPLHLSVQATGRQVPIVVTNKVTGKPLAGVQIKVLSTEAKTDAAGKATIVLPTTATTQKATLNLSGYNSADVTVQVTDKVVAANSFSLSPAGKLYFLSNKSGKIDVVKSNLDGSDRQTVLAGTGNEDPQSTSLLASRDWKYLALLAKRSGDNASVYLIDTTNGDKLTTVDEGNASFTLVGWADDTFNYQVARNNVQAWQPNAQALKSYNAVTSKLTTVDQTQAEGTNSYDYGYTNFSGVYILDNELVYVKNWYSSYNNSHLTDKNVSLISVKPDGSSRKTIKDFPIPAGVNYYYVNLQLYEPYGIYVQVPSADNTANTYYAYEDGKLTTKPDVTDTIYNKGYDTYLISPSNKQTFWAEQRDGKNALFVGDKDAKNEKQIATLSEYSPYGWYGDGYLLVSKNSSELYIMAADGNTPPQKITDYYKPPLTYQGYGGGYGGI